MGLETGFNGPGIQWSTLNQSRLSMLEVYLWLLGEACLLLLIALYLDQVMPGEGRQGRHWLFPLRCLLPASRRRGWEDPDSSEADAKAEGGEDVAAERRRVETAKPGEFAVRVLGLRKTFGRGRDAVHALRGVTFGIREGECLGVLGANGAGKTTLISLLTSLYTPSGGRAEICGYDLLSESDRIHALMGVCPQEDILWPNLTGAEHLYF